MATSSIETNLDTIQRGLASCIISLHQAYIVTHRVTAEDAKEAVNRMVLDILRNTLGIDSPEDNTQEAFKAQVDKYLAEYRSKQDKGYVGLLKLRDSLG